MAELVTASRTASVLLAFAGAEGELGISEVARRLNLAKSVTHRIVTTLVAAGLLGREETGSRYRLGPRAVELGLAAIGASDPRSVALPIMSELARTTGETMTMSLRAGTERVYVSQVESTQDVHMSVEIGRRFPLYAGASGRAILAFLPEDELDRYLAHTVLAPLTPATITDPLNLREELRATRTLGYAVSHGERDSWAASVAVPWRAGGLTIGSLSVCGPLARFSGERTAEFGRALLDATRRASSPARRSRDPVPASRRERSG